MKIDPSDTPNSFHEGVEGADAEAIAELVRATRSRGPRPEAVQRIASRLADAGALDPTALSQRGPAAASSAAPRIAGKLGSYKAGALVLAVAVGSLLAWRATYTSAAAPDVPVIAGHAASDLARLPSESPSTGASRAAAQAENVESTAAERPSGGGVGVPAVSIDSLPTAAPTTRAPAAPAIASTAAPSTGEPTRVAAENGDAKSAAPEHLLVRRAQDALVSDPARALALADEHAVRYPSGELTQEREVVAVDALSKLGRREEAVLRARALVRRSPRTPYVAHLEKAIGQPLTNLSDRGGSANPDGSPKP